MDDVVKKYTDQYKSEVSKLENQLTSLQEENGAMDAIGDVTDFLKNTICPIVSSALSVVGFIPTWIPGLGQIRQVLELIKNLCNTIH